MHYQTQRNISPKSFKTSCVIKVVISDPTDNISIITYDWILITTEIRCLYIPLPKHDNGCKLRKIGQCCSTNFLKLFMRQRNKCQGLVVRGRGFPWKLSCDRIRQRPRSGLLNAAVHSWLGLRARPGLQVNPETIQLPCL
ncbi:hypothetical protein PHYBLDRAFT_63833 [Phycomyces blakesleeanus NRRL 1555(-)]|uniref:Uncharacterized protein n=1 Tax=Phycomyces blakesleeanus (strain ATCC 8743b / DSM 1359 / FGSC 10004 / NBRC 33097 / NRRL 1555) TaxID=763407 RepID=A0A167MW15_PHYB8|nr:hypothetical protein PHYBLDRAFT_63833 [Phycomyces blakesleeanus NRRL 1555(-)]OAD74214.1 hypothetical protein PHYBLDRAFT_63833 [Phycomyces blakesleeanus NRRL 1555(-)]|eukprot:XP_018292254.1 hypothetical protein PHYBLDRAFT_63833 [Phycomyces blakesleeanus NRRL 1555(-)]